MLSGCISVFAAWAMRNAGVSKEQLHGGDGSSGGGGEGTVPPLMVAAYGGCLTTRLVSTLLDPSRGSSLQD